LVGGTQHNHQTLPMVLSVADVDCSHETATCVAGETSLHSRITLFQQRIGIFPIEDSRDFPQRISEFSTVVQCAGDVPKVGYFEERVNRDCKIPHTAHVVLIGQTVRVVERGRFQTQLLSSSVHFMDEFRLVKSNVLLVAGNIHKFWLVGMFIPLVCGDGRFSYKPSEVGSQHQ
jgi:hypothetical protein